ncbi:lysozyme inhibitor LprI family protein [Acinetobacter radioresistens]|uniref:lysozyme inhibitor LprI family protein n=1 Tax=Acinetobacter radioresistens TaxID=40216 RepID=UPI0032137637
MKKIFLLTILISGGAWADCTNPQNSFEGQKCLSNEVTSLKKDLNSIYSKAYTSTEAKKELDASQKKWLAFKEAQCGDFVVADTQGSPATISTDLYCQTILIKQRIDFLKEFLVN